MAYEVRDMSGSVFKNTRRDRENSPELTGSGMIFGKDVWINAWVKVDKNGNKWISFSFKEKQPKPETDTRPMSQITDDEIPF